MRKRLRRLPDYLIGATVLIAAIAMPLYVFSSANHKGSATAVAAKSASAHGSVSSAAESTLSGFLRKYLSMPLTGASVSPRSSAITHRRKSKPATAIASPRTSPAAAATATPAPPSGPSVTISAKPTVGPAPLAVTVQPSIADQKPVVNVLIDCGSGAGPSEVSSPWTTSCQYASPGVFVITVVAFDIDTKTSQATISVGVTAPSPSPSP